VLLDAYLCREPIASLRLQQVLDAMLANADAALALVLEICVDAHARAARAEDPLAPGGRHGRRRVLPGAPLGWGKDEGTPQCPPVPPPLQLLAAPLQTRARPPLPPCSRPTRPRTLVAPAAQAGRRASLSGVAQGARGGAARPGGPGPAGARGAARGARGAALPHRGGLGGPPSRKDYIAAGDVVIAVVADAAARQHARAARRRARAARVRAAHGGRAAGGVGVRPDSKVRVGRWGQEAWVLFLLDSKVRWTMGGQEGCPTHTHTRPPRTPPPLYREKLVAVRTLREVTALTQEKLQFLAPERTWPARGPAARALAHRTRAWTASARCP